MFSKNMTMPYFHCKGTYGVTIFLGEKIILGGRKDNTKKIPHRKQHLESILFQKKFTSHLLYKRKKTAKRKYQILIFLFIMKRSCLQDSETYKLVTGKSYFHLVLLFSYFVSLLVVKKESRTTCKCKHLISTITNNISGKATSYCPVQEGWTT